MLKSEIRKELLAKRKMLSASDCMIGLWPEARKAGIEALVSVVAQLSERNW